MTTKKILYSSSLQLVSKIGIMLKGVGGDLVSTFFLHPQYFFPELPVL